MTNKFKVKSLILAMGMTVASSPVYAEEGANEDEGQTMVVVGSRSAPRSVGDSPVPVDVISAEEMMANGTSDMTSLLAQVAPSFNVNTQPISDAATMVRPANLRGLSPDSTLILVNGKRRHRSAVIAFLGGGISDGAQGPDTAVIPAIALKQVEVLRDGASAQYGSDAIAGVINFVLKDNSDGGMIEAKMGQYSEGDGDQFTIAGNIGLPLTERGFANFSYELNNQDATDRSVQRTDAANLFANGNTDVNNPAQIWGAPNVNDDMKVFMNVGLELSNNSEAYMFGNWAEREVDGGFFYRNPHNRGSVNSIDGGATLLIGDLDPNDGVDCSSFVVPIPADGSNVIDSAAYQAIDFASYGDPTSGACWAFNELFPGGFTPRFGGDVTDVSLVMGTRGEFSGGTTYDFSVSVGQNQADFRIRNTVNASLGPASPTSFRPGSYTQLEKSFNADFSKDLDINVATTISYGVEFREESFEITNGDQASFEVGSLAAQGFSIGSNGFQGFKPKDAGVFSRRSKAAFFDLETFVTDDWMVGLALRMEDFSDFGSTFDYKLASKYDINESFSVRGSYSTGFRAPTIGQSSVQNVSTAFAAGALSEVATLPPTSAVALELGGKPLQPEESTSFALGAVYESGDFFMTLDFYNIDVDGRISQTSDIPVTPDVVASLLAQGNTDALNLANIRYFTNDFDTSTTGFDLVANYSYDALGGEVKHALAYNHNKTDVNVDWIDTVDENGDPNPDGIRQNEEIQGNINNTKIRQLEENLPNDRFTFTTNFLKDSWSLMARVNYYGSYYEAHLDDPGLPVNSGSEFTIDTEFNMDISEDIGFALGVSNLLDERPLELNSVIIDPDPNVSGDEFNLGSDVVGAKYPVTSPMGFNGRFYYAKATYRF